MNTPLKTFVAKAGAWAAVAAAIHVIMEMFLGGPLPYVVPAILVAAAGWLAVADRTPVAHAVLLRRGVALLFLAVAAWIALPAEEGAGIPWQPYSPELVDAARKGNKPVLIDFRASWCGPCKEMERTVFSRRQVIHDASDFLALQVDLSEPDEATQKIAQQYNIDALPTVVFLAADGRERANLRLVGFERSEAFLQRLQQAR